MTTTECREDRVTSLTVLPEPRPAALSETVNQRTGHIRASGHLTSLGADLLRGTADHLRSAGHSRVVLDLDVEAADADGLAILRSLRSAFAADGVELLIRSAHGVIVA